MAIVRADCQLSVSFLKEGKQFVAYSPALDICTCGKTLAQARKRFAEASSLFLEELYKKGTLQEVLTNLGWKVQNEKLVPPVVVAQEEQKVSVPV